MTGSVTTPNLGIRGSEHFLRGRRRYWTGARVGVPTPGTNWVGFGSLVYTLRQCPCEGHATPSSEALHMLQDSGREGASGGGLRGGGEGEEFPDHCPTGRLFLWNPRPGRHPHCHGISQG